MFPDLKQARKKPVPNACTESGPERGCSRILETGNFPDFFRENLVPGKWHSGTQTYLCSLLQILIFLQIYKTQWPVKPLLENPQSTIMPSQQKILISKHEEVLSTMIV